MTAEYSISGNGWSRLKEIAPRVAVLRDFALTACPVLPLLPSRKRATRNNADAARA
jgi:hypothetical protein